MVTSDTTIHRRRNTIHSTKEMMLVGVDMWEVVVGGQFI